VNREDAWARRSTKNGRLAILGIASFVLAGCVGEAPVELRQVELRIRNASGEARAVDVTSCTRSGSEATVDGFAKRLEPGERTVESVKAAASGTLEVRAYTAGRVRRCTWSWSRTLEPESEDTSVICAIEIDR